MSDIILIFPPVWDIYSPYTSLPYLNGFLKSKGLKTTIWDANIEIQDQIISDSYLHERIVALEKNISDYSNKTSQFQRLLKKIELGKLIVGKIDETKQKMRLESNWEAILKCQNIIGNAQAVICNDQQFTTSFSPYKTLSSLKAAVENIERNIFYTYLQSHLSDKLANFSGKLAGISVTGVSQLVHAFVIARLIKEKRPDIKIVMGGAIIPYLQDVFLTQDQFPEIDFLVSGEGETALYKVIEAVRTNGSFTKIPNLLYRDYNGRYCLSSSRYVENMDDFPVPDYDDLPLDLYLLPNLFSYVSARGCHWNRCSFCSLNCNYGHRYHCRNLDKVIDDIVCLKRKYNLKNLFFNDEAITPDRLLKLAQKILESRLDFKWHALLRMEDGFSDEHFQTAYNAGLRLIFFGAESGAQPTLDIMHKGTKVAVMERVLKASHEAGIANHVAMIADFPGDDCIEETYRFLEKNKQYIDSLTCATFFLEKHSYVYRHPEKFGITIHKVPDDYFGLSFPFSNPNGKDLSYADYKYLISKCSDFHFNPNEYSQYDPRCYFVRLVDIGKAGIRKQSQNKILNKKQTIGLMQKGDFYISTNPDVCVNELENGLLLAYRKICDHAIFNEVTCTILKESKKTILFADLLKTLQKIFNVDKQILKRDMQYILPLLVVLNFIEVRPCGSIC